MATEKTPIVDKNGKATHVHKKVEGATTSRQLPDVPRLVTPVNLIHHPGKGAPYFPQSYVDDFDFTDDAVREGGSVGESIHLINDADGTQSNGKVRWVELTDNNTNQSSDFTIVPPKDGTPIIVRARADVPNLRVDSGNAVIALTNSGETHLTVSGTANVVVMCHQGSTPHITIEGSPRLTIVPQHRVNGHIYNFEGTADMEVDPYDDVDFQFEVHESEDD